MTDLPKSPGNKNKANQTSQKSVDAKAKLEKVNTVNVDSTTPSITEEGAAQAQIDAKQAADKPSYAKKSQATAKPNTTTQNSAKTPRMTSKRSQQESTQEESKEKKPAKTGLLWFFTLINLIILILLAVGAYWYYTQISQEESDKASVTLQLEQQLANLENGQQRSVANINKEFKKIETSQQSQSQSAGKLLAQIQQNLAQIEQNTLSNNAVQKRISEVSGRRPSDWLLAEANYLVNMAGRKLYLEQDIRTAIALLQEADARLEDLNDPTLFPVRTLIAADVQSLQSIKPTSTNSIALTISGMLSKVSNLPLEVMQLPEPEPQEDMTLSEDVSDWRQNLSRTWQSIIGDLVTVTDLDAPLEPYLAERQRWLIEQQLKHALSQAQSAVLNEQQALYVASIQTAIDLLTEHYKLDDAGVNQFINTLQGLQQADFTRNLPKRLESQSSLKDVVESRMQNLFNNTPSVQEDDDVEGSQL